MPTLTTRLSVEESRPLAILEVLAAFRRAPDLPGCARALGVSRSALCRWIAAYPALEEGIDALRRVLPVAVAPSGERRDRRRGAKRGTRLAHSGVRGAKPATQPLVSSVQAALQK